MLDPIRNDRRRPMADGIAVLDLGKTNLKLVVVDPAGRVVETTTADNRPRPGPPYPQVDAAAVWDWLLHALAGAGRRHRILAVVPTTYGSTAALVDGRELVLPILDYEAEPPDAVARAYAAVAPPFAEVYAPTNPAGLTLGRQLFWQERAWPEAFARTRAILTYPQYWAWRLTGVAAAEATSLGAQTHLWNPLDRGVSSLVRRRGWTDRLPPLRRPDEVLGPLRPEVAAATGLPPDTPVLTGVHDSNANYFRYLAAGFRDFTLMSTGTWLITFNAGQPLDRLDPARDTNANTDVFGRPVACSRFMLGREYAILAGAGATTAGPDDVARLVAAGTMALPSFTDSGGPCPGAGGRGRIAGPAPGDGAARTALASLYGALMSAEALDAVGARGDLVLDGGFAGHALYAGLLAALRPGQRLRASAEREGTAVGAALLWRRAERTAPVPVALRDVPPLDLPGLDAYAARWRAVGRERAVGPTGGGERRARDQSR